MDRDVKTGGQAFPSEGEGHGDPMYHSPGMTLRDYFAAKAMSAMFSNRSRYNNWHSAISEEAYHIADAMMREREK